MSRRYYKYKFQYDDNCGNLKEAIIYEERDAVMDVNTFYNDKGDIIYATGTISYIARLGAILRGGLPDDIEVTRIDKREFDSIFESTD